MAPLHIAMSSTRVCVQFHYSALQRWTERLLLYQRAQRRKKKVARDTLGRGASAVAAAHGAP